VSNKIIKIKLSSTFLARTKCVQCKNNGIYLCIKLPQAFKDNRNDYYFNLVKKHTKDLSSIVDELFSGISDLSHRTDYKNFNPRIHKSYKYDNDTYVEMICCACGKLVWAFSQKMFEKKNDVILRKYNDTYPQTIKD
jgi:hypothetical protein